MGLHNSTFGDVVDALASVAIAGLFGGPIAAGQTLLEKAIPAVRQLVGANIATKGLKRELKTALEEWAEREGVELNEVHAGYARALDIISAAGLDAGGLAAFDFDPKRVTGEIVRSARSMDRFPEGEAFYMVAAQVIEVTYANLIHHYCGKEPILVPVLRSLRADLDARLTDMSSVLIRLEGTIEAAGSAVVEVHDSVASQASRAEFLTYLRTRIVDWDRHLWLPINRASSSMERQLRARVTSWRPSSQYEDIGQAISRPGEAFDADDLERAFAGRPMLVVLGIPGSGKTWLARRYARRAARAAIEQLEQGAPLESVEIPLLVTWETWTRNPDGDDRESLVRAAFSSGLGYSDLGRRTTERLMRTLTLGHVKVLAVIDSLDEGADKRTASPRLQSLANIRDWRAIVTTRTSAWQNTQLPEGEAAQVVELLELEYPRDVDGFVDAWFLSKPAIADELKQQIRTRPELRRSSTLPLLLTFYCILASDRSRPHSRLPSKRRELYQEVLAQLIEGQWRINAPGPDSQPDLHECLRRLNVWAWDSVRGIGRGGWEQTFIPEHDPPDGIAAGVKAIAPRTGNRRERRFLHRTIQEHLVAEYIAELPAQQAWDILKLHVWTRHDGWELVLPAAIAAHHQERPWELLLKAKAAMDYRLAMYDKWRGQREASAARLLARVASESNDNFWENAPPDLEGWRSRLLQSFSGSQGWLHVAEIPWVISGLGGSVEQVGDALDVMMTRISIGDPDRLDSMVETLLRLDGSQTRVAKMTELLINELPHAAQHLHSSRLAAQIARALVKLGASSEGLLHE